jgi:uncharacterized protein
MIGPHITLIIKVTNACDMKCRYCFIEPAVFHQTMKLATMKKVVRAFLDSDHFQSVHFVWHGGEPLLRGRRFFEQVIAEEKARPTRVLYQNSVQTNATRLDDDMLELLVSHGFHIGLSLDGPRRLNGRSRMMRVLGHDERAPHEVTVDAAERLRQKGQVAGAIVVVNRLNVDQPEAIYREFKRRNIHMQLNPLVQSGVAAAGGEDLGITADEYGRFMTRLFDMWFDDPRPTISIEPFQHHIARMLGVATSPSCHFAKNCHKSFLGVSPRGDLFPCGMFQGEPEFRYGNIHELGPEEVASTPLFARIDSREARVLETCSRCAFLDLCYSGCMFHSLKNARAFDEKDYYCGSYKMYFEHMLRRLHADLSRARKRTSPAAQATSQLAG